jgi:uncharacterized membrane protein YgcG
MLRRSANADAVVYSAPFASTYVNQLYQGLTGQAPTTDQFQSGVNGIENNQFSLFDLAHAVAGSSAAQSHLALSNTNAATIQAWASMIYQGAFGSANVPPDALAAITFDLHQGASPQNVAANIVASGGNYAATETLASWIRTIYRDLLGRDATPQEVAGAIGLFDAGAVNMTSYAQAVQNSTEARIYYVRQVFIQYLHRDPGSAAAAQFAGYSRPEDVIVAVVSSPEYFNLNGGSIPAYVSAAFRDITGNASIQTTNPTAFQNWVTELETGVAPHEIVTPVVEPMLRGHRVARTRHARHPRPKPVRHPHPKPIRHPRPKRGHGQTGGGGNTGGGSGGGGTGGGGTGGGGGGGGGQPVTLATLPLALVTTSDYFNQLVVADFFRYLPDETQGVLRTGLGNPTGGVATNPNPSQVAFFVGQLQAGTPSSMIITEMITSPKYVGNASYYKGFFQSNGIRA